MNKKSIAVCMLAVLAFAVTPVVSATELGAETKADFGVRLGQSLRADVKGEADVRVREEVKKRPARTLDVIVTARTDRRLTVSAKDGATYTVEATNARIKGGIENITIGDSIIIKGYVFGSTILAESIAEPGAERDIETKRREYRENVENLVAKAKKERVTVVGTITAIHGASITINPLGRKATSTVTTDANTVVKARSAATTTAALSVGQNVLVIGTTVATSTAGDSVTASVVKVLGKGLGHLRFWLWFQ